MQRARRRSADASRRQRLQLVETDRRSRAPRPVRFVVKVVAGMFRGDRPLVAMTLVISALGMSLLVGPAQQYFDERSRVDLLRTTEARLDTEVQRLEQRVADLHDPEHIEILAREQHGLVRQGEVAYSIVPPARSDSMAGPSMAMVAASPDEAEEDAWYARLWQMVGAWIGGAS